MAKILTFRVLDHGCDHEQYFPGCGVSFTQYEACVTGIGDSAKEAANDALEQLYEAVPCDNLAVCDAEALQSACDAQSDAIDTGDSTDPGWWHYVSIQWRLACKSEGER